MSNITFVIFTYNEEARIERVIKNFKDFGKILIADNKSTDRTQEIARSYGCDILIREKHYEFVENQEMVDLIYDAISTDWIYWGFADEMLEKKTLIKINSIIATGKYDIINIDRKNYFYGRFCFDLYHARTNKIFKKNTIDFNGNLIHGMGKPTVSSDKIYKLRDKYFVHHFISNSAQSYINVINRYTERELEGNYKTKTSILYAILIMSKNIIKDFLFNKGYRAGFAGIALTELTLIYTLVKNMKLYEDKNKLNTLKIEEINNKHRDELLSDL